MLVAFYHYPAGKEFYKVLHHKLVCWWTHGDYSAGWPKIYGEE